MFAILPVFIVSLPPRFFPRHTPFGTSYNAFLLCGTQKSVLIETVKATKPEFWNQFITRFDEVKKIRKDFKIDYVIHNHTEPDHSGSSFRFIHERYPDATIIATPTAIKNLEKIANNNSFKRIEANNDLKIDLGGYTLRFIIAPFLHWPDSMFTYCPELQALFTCDVFGAHYCTPKVFNNQLTTKQENDDYASAYK